MIGRANSLRRAVQRITDHIEQGKIHWTGQNILGKVKYIEQGKIYWARLNILNNVEYIEQGKIY